VTNANGVTVNSGTITITVAAAGSAGSGSTDGPLPLWSLYALAAGIVGIAMRRLRASTPSR
jgi:hypothetical protein